MAITGSITDSYSAALITNKFKVTLYWQLDDRSFQNNNSLVKYQLKCLRLGGNAGNADWTVTINGTEYKGTYQNDIKGDSEVVITSGSITIPHNSDGTKTFSYSFNYQQSSIVKATASGTGVLEAIPRPATITSAQDFNDEQSPTVYYSNTAGTKLTDLDACISFTGAKDDIPYRAINMNAGNYTFEFTDAEKQTLWSYLSTSTKGTVRFYIRSKWGGETVHSYKTYNLTLINTTPVFTPQIYDVNSNTLELTGDRNTLIKYHSTLYVDTGARAKKGASITSHKIVCGSETKTSIPAYFYNVESPEVTFTATDSRGQSDTRTTSKKFVNYIHPTCHISITPPGTDGLIRFNVWGNCYAGYFGEHEDALYNELTIGYRYISSAGEVGDWEYEDYVYLNPNNTYNRSYEVTVPDYTKAYTVEVSIYDRLESASSDVTVRAQTVFDWDSNDFNFNVPVNFAAGFTIGGKGYKTLINGQFKLTSSSDAINLPEPISKQANGIVLIFTPFNTSTNLADDTKCMPFFVSKHAIEYARATNNLSNPLYTFFLMDKADFASIGSKSMYIGDERIAGYASNTSSGTKNGITFDNNKFVLRSILGV